MAATSCGSGREVGEAREKTRTDLDEKLEKLERRQGEVGKGKENHEKPLLIKSAIRNLDRQRGRSDGGSDMGRRGSHFLPRITWQI